MSKTSKYRLAYSLLNKTCVYCERPVGQYPYYKITQTDAKNTDKEAGMYKFKTTDLIASIEHITELKG